MKFRYVTLRPRDKRLAGAVVASHGRISLLDESFICLAGPLAQAIATGFFKEGRTTGELLDHIQVTCGGCNDLEYFFEAEEQLTSWGHERDLCDVVDMHIEGVRDLAPAIGAVARALYDSSRALTYREVEAISLKAQAQHQAGAH